MNYFDGDDAPNDPFINFAGSVIIGILLVVLLTPVLSVLWALFALPFK